VDRRRLGSGGAISAAALVVVCVLIAAALGLIIGAVWGLSGKGGVAAPPRTRTPTPSTPADTSTPTGTGSGTSSSTPSTPVASSTPPPVVTGSAPPAPATTTTSADGWRLGSWRITTTGGTIGVDTTARNTATGTRSADLVLFVYVNGTNVATTTAHVADVPPGESVPVHFAGSDPWTAGPKVLLLQVA